jgi:hypothetical protein
VSLCLRLPTGTTRRVHDGLSIPHQKTLEGRMVPFNLQARSHELSLTRGENTDGKRLEPGPSREPGW